MKITEVLRAWRCHQEMTVREAAEHIGIQWSTYARIEKGQGMSGETLAILWRWMLGD